MKIKYSPGQEPIRGDYNGFTFIPGRTYQEMMSSQRNDRKRYEFQWLRQQNNQKAVRGWRDMPPDVKTAWITFADTYPQPSKSDPNVFLNGYQLFVKRNSYQFLHEGISSDYILYPELSQLPDPSFTAEISDNGMCLDVTEWYIRNFGLLPQVGDSLLCRIVPVATNSGQFFPTYQATLIVQEVFIDGLFLSIDFSNNIQGIEYSCYLSFRVRPGVLYQSTKFRYMGCFKPTQFIQLTDTPNSYVDQQGKYVAVKVDESGLEFVDPPDPGLDCPAVMACPGIITINNNVDSILDYLTQYQNTSIPPVKYGYLYNVRGQLDARGLFNSGWRLPTNTEWYIIINALGGQAVAGGPCKETGLTYWDSPNTGATNTAKFNGRGASRCDGWRNYSSFKIEFCFCSSNRRTADSFYGGNLLYNATTMYCIGGWPDGYGISMRPMNPSTTLSNGQQGLYFGNDGRIYRTICIGTIEILADNLCESKFVNGETIPIVTDPTTWHDTTTCMRTYSNNDPTNT